jgi:uncharacterized membrane protein
MGGGGVATSNGAVEDRGQRLAKLRDDTQRALAAFLGLPTAIIAGFLALAAVMFFLDRANFAPLAATRAFLRAGIFQDAQATSDLLGAIAAGLITVASITLSLLLLAVQQAAGSMTAAVIDQFLRRRLNQVYFGFFVGLALYALVILATVTPAYNPVFGASLALLLTMVALPLLIVLLYNTLDQMRPEVVIGAIHEHTLAARARQRDLLRRTRRESRCRAPLLVPVRAPTHGFVARIDLDAIDALRRRAPDEFEVVLLASIGAFVAFHDIIAQVKAHTAATAALAERAVAAAIRLDDQRDLRDDPAHGIEQMAMIAWTSISTSKSSPMPGLMTIRGLRDLLARWSAPGNEARGEASMVPVVYTDTVLVQLMDALESLAVVSTESMQHQCFAEVARALATLFDRLSPDVQRRAEDLIRRTMTGLGDHILTADLDAALGDLHAALVTAGRFETAAMLQTAQAEFGRTIGAFNSRSTRAPARRTAGASDGSLGGRERDDQHR